MSVRPNDSAVSSTDILVQLAEIVRLVTNLPSNEVRTERHLVDDLHIDSLAMVEILEGASQHFGIVIDDEAAKDLIRVRDLVDHLVERLRLR